MSATASYPLTYYRRFAERLLSDIELLHDDIEFAEQGGRVLTAADFSEIYAYCFSSSSSFLSSLDGDLLDEVNARALIPELHTAIMFFHMFETDEPLWLLDPYIVELRNFIRNIESSRLKGAVKSIAEVLRQHRNISESEEYDALSDLAARAQDEGRTLSREENQRIVEFVERFAPAMFFQGGQYEADPSVRLQELLQKNRLVVASDPPPETLRGDNDTVERWKEQLARLRPGRDGQNASDALAVGTLHSMNRWLMSKERPQRLVLLTRSRHMHAVMHQDVDGGFWRDVGGNALRHPRSVLALLDEGEIVRNAPIAKQRRALEKWSRTLGPLVESKTALLDIRSPLTPQEMVRRHVAVIANVWRRYCGAKAVTIALGRQFQDKNKELQAIGFFLDPDNVKRSVRARLNETEIKLGASTFKTATMISDEMRQVRATLADQESSARKVPRSIPITHSDGDFIQIASAHGSPMPFRVAVSDPRISAALKENFADPSMAFVALSEDYMLEPRNGQQLAPATEAEWYVAVAYVCAALGAWRAAQRASEYVLESIDADNVEAILIRAKAWRHLSESFDELYPIAESLRQMATGPHPAILDSTRLFSEQLKYYFISMRRAIDVRNLTGVKATRICIESDLRYISKRSYSEIKTVEDCELLNNVVYHSIQMHEKAQDVLPLQVILGYFYDFERGLANVYGEAYESWPDNFVDTYCWVRLHLLRAGLIGQLTDDELRVEEERILQPLLLVAEREYVSNVDISDFRIHAQQAKTFFTGSNR